MRTDLLTQLKNLFQTDSGFTISFEGLKVVSEANIGASELELQKMSSYLSYTPPEEYIEFLRNFNGCDIFRYDNIDGFSFLSTQKVIQTNHNLKEEYGTDWDNNIIVFCECIGEGNYIGFRAKNQKNYEIVDCFHEYLPSEWKNISFSLESFLENLLNSKGKKFWLSD